MGEEGRLVVAATEKIERKWWQCRVSSVEEVAMVVG